MKIRREQELVFVEDALKRYEDEMVIHLQKYFPKETESLGESKTREAIRFGIERAQHYGFTSRRDVCLFIEVMFAFGYNFDQDPALPWAKEILNDSKIRNPSIRVDRLRAMAIKYADHARGIHQA